MITETVKIKILGLGGAGTNAVRDFLKISSTMRCAVIDTDLQSLLAAGEISERLLIRSEKSACFLKSENKTLKESESSLLEFDKDENPSTTFSPEISLKNAVSEIIEGVDLLIISAGLGGETGGELAAAISHMASKRGALVLNFCILPFSSEGDKKMDKALADFDAIRSRAPAIALPNDVTLAKETLPILEAFRRANSHMNSAVNSISQMILKRGLVNVDFKSFREMFAKDFDHTVFCIGSGEGDNYLQEALENFDGCPLCSFKAPKRLLVNFKCPPDFDVSKMNAAFEHVSKKFGRNTNITFGALIDENLSRRLEICAIGVTDEDLPLNAEENEENNKEEEIKIFEDKTVFENSLTPQNPVAQTPEPKQNNEPATFEKTPTLTEEKISDNLSEKENKTLKPEPEKVDEKKSPEAKKFNFFGFGSKNANKKKQEKITENQGEFSFVEIDQQRGFFSDTPPNMRAGVDLDIPTYMRKNIKINL